MEFSANNFKIFLKSMHAGINHSAEHLDPAFPPLPACPPRFPPAGLPGRRLRLPANAPNDVQIILTKSSHVEPVLPHPAPRGPR